jgi:hypothetical protein
MGRNIFARRTATGAVRAVFAAALLVVLVGGCGSAGTSGSGSGSGSSSGDVKTESRDVQGFDSVEFSGAGTLTIEQTGTESLEIQADARARAGTTSAG